MPEPIDTKKEMTNFLPQALSFTASPSPSPLDGPADGSTETAPLANGSTAASTDGSTSLPAPAHDSSAAPATADDAAPNSTTAPDSATAPESTAAKDSAKAIAADLTQILAYFQAQERLVKGALKELKKLAVLLTEPIDEAFAVERQTEKATSVTGPLSNAPLTAALTAIRERLPAWKQEKVLAFGRQLIAEFQVKGLELTGKGSEFRSGGFEIRTDLSAGQARLEYAREPIAEKVPLKPAAILKAYERAVKDIAGRKTDPEAFLALLFQAYQRTIAAASQGMGARANIVEVLAETAFLLQRDVFRRDPRRELFRSYSRAHFSHDLNLLRRQNALVFNGWRLNIGSATIDFAEDRRKALYLTDGRGGGNFIMYLSFIQMGKRDESHSA